MYYKQKKMCHRVLLTAGVGLFALFGFSRTATGDGMPMPAIDAVDTHVQATAQRALLWLRDEAWEIHIQPVFDRAQGKAAWVVPFPVLPTVSESSAELFSDLEVITSPVFIKYCEKWHGGGESGCDSSDGGSASGFNKNNSDVGSTVKVWDSGQVGQLDYVVLSAAEGDDLAKYLQDEGYMLPDGVPDLIGDFETEGQYFFVAQLSAEADPQKPISPVRFKLPDMVTPLYPLRLTGLSVNGTQKLELTLWVVYPNERLSQSLTFFPDSHPYGRLAGNPMDGEAYEAALNEFFQANSSSHLLLLYGDMISDSVAVQGQRCDKDDYFHYDLCASAEDLNLQDKVWSPEIQEMIGDETRLFRFAARLDDVAMEIDLTLEETSWVSSYQVDNVFSEMTGTCPKDEEQDEEYVSCSVGRGWRFPGWFGLTLLAWVALLWMKRRR